ncbi:MAG: RNA 2',3'-cyclic phosphodiesterase [Planctomycetaceae bacterium]|nr:RNA 2',3'-cyclic phosphodiesterase [Planctomycetaceae bacterium]
MARIRSFVAVELAPSVAARAGKLIDELRVSAAQVNWVKTQQMHLTLKFLGDVQDTETPDICRVVADVAKKFEPFEITCRGAGAFPTAEHPRTLWIGIEDGAEELCALQAALENALKDELGFPKEARRFQPHLTIGRVKHEPPSARGELTDLVVKHANFDADLSVIDEVVVLASFLGRSGPNYEALGRADLGI